MPLFSHTDAHTSNTSDASHTLVSKQFNQQSNSNENVCESENCQFHRCHFGHCSFTTASVASAYLPTQAGFQTEDLEKTPVPIYLSFPIKPPRV